ncbi:MAG: pyridoxamine 5'-phosphate oxidase family protein [Burkholderiales bacterium]
MTQLDSDAALRSLYAAPGERALRKQLDRLDAHCRNFIALSPFLVMASTDSEGRMDASPRGGAPGFVKVADERTLLIPDSKGNNRLDSLSNLLRAPGVGLLFLVPGVDETLRINGRAALSTDAAHVEACADERHRPPLVIVVEVQEAYLHCAKALLRAKLWNPAAKQERSVLPTMNQMLKDQIGQEGEPESEAAMRARYQADL